MASSVSEESKLASNQPVVICCHRRPLLPLEPASDGFQQAVPGLTTASPTLGLKLGMGRKTRVQSFHGRRGYESIGMTAENLRIHCPPALPVIVRASRTTPEIDGYCVRRPNKFMITLDHTSSCEGALNTLLHEWAHALAWNFSLEKASRDLASGDISAETYEEISHDAAFGVAFATVWRTFTSRIIPVLNLYAR
jgi:hypothetical protein